MATMALAEWRTKLTVMPMVSFGIDDQNNLGIIFRVGRITTRNGVQPQKVNGQYNGDNFHDVKITRIVSNWIANEC